VTGEEAFEIAAAVAAISGLAALLIMALVAVIGTWRLFLHASETALASARAAVTVEELARRLTTPAGASGAGAAGGFEELRDQAELLVEQQQRLQEMARNMIDAAAAEGAPSSLALDDLESAVTRLDTTVGQMAASLANLIQLLEGRGRR
jgi:hypothetical protein